MGSFKPGAATGPMRGSVRKLALLACSLFVGGCSATLDAMPQEIVQRGQQNDASLTRACASLQTVLAHRPGDNTSVLSLSRACDCYVSYVLAEKNLLPDEQVALLARAEASMLGANPLAEERLTDAAKLANRLSAVLLANGADQAALEAAARATWYEQRGHTAEIMNESRPARSASFDEQVAYDTAIIEKRAARTAAILNTISQVSSTVSGGLQQNAQIAGQYNPKTAKAYQDLANMADKVATATNVEVRTPLGMPDAVEMVSLVGGPAQLDEFNAIVTKEDGKYGNALVNAFSVRLAAWPSRSEAYNKAMTSFRPGQDPNVSLRAIAELLGVSPPDPAPVPVSAPRVAAESASAPSPSHATSVPTSPAPPPPPDTSAGRGFYCQGTGPGIDTMSCGRADCTTSAAGTAKTIPGWTCVRRPSAFCFSTLMNGTIPGKTCQTTMPVCLSILPLYEQQKNVQITQRCTETQ
jgi:hypothetical protein